MSNWELINSYKQLLVVGHTSAGKTTLVNRIQQHLQNLDKKVSAKPFSYATTQTLGIERTVLSRNCENMLCVEIGGTMKPTWAAYLVKCDCVMFVIDVTDRICIAQAFMDLLMLLSDKRSASKPFLIALNKSEVDICQRISRYELNSMVRLEEIVSQSKNRRIKIVETSAVSSMNLPMVIDTLFALLRGS